MIFPRSYGREIRLLLTSGETQIYKIGFGYEQAAMHEVLKHYDAQRLNPAEAGLLLCAIGRLTERPRPKSSPWLARMRRWVSVVIERAVVVIVGRNETECCGK